jgi:hypothetical protein
MLCAEAYAHDRPSVRYFDALFLVLRGERDHCRRMFLWEAEARELPERARRAGL